MPTATVPAYLNKARVKVNNSDISTALRFGLLFPIWISVEDQWKEFEKKKEKESKGRSNHRPITDLCNRLGDAALNAAVNEGLITTLWNKYRPGVSDDQTASWDFDFVEDVGGYNAGISHAFRLRQSLIVESIRQNCSVGCSVLELSGRTTAPFTTGLGNEHPLENGFSFLNPHGVPYLPGSGVKGVLRRAAQELMAIEGSAWNKWETAPAGKVSIGGNELELSAIDVLYGREPDRGESDHLRGVLSFWDVVPEVAGNRLRVDVMTPHQSHYYFNISSKDAGGSSAPHDSGQPNPITFLTLPSGSIFDFRIVCDLQRLARLSQDLLSCWEDLVKEALKYAFEWLGFGAKTAVGYGAMKDDAEATTKLAKQLDEARAAAEDRRIKAELEAKLAREAEEKRLAEEARLSELSPAQIELEEIAKQWAEVVSARKFSQDEPDNKSKYWRALDELSRKALSSWESADCHAAAAFISQWGPRMVRVRDERDFRKRLKIKDLQNKV